MSDFVHLHVHSEYSLLDGACRIDELVAVAAADGQKALAITDHGVAYGAFRFFKACKKQGIKPIIGSEVYISEDRTRRAGREDGIHHLILLCKNKKGYENLCFLLSKAFEEGFYYKPRIDFALLSQHAEGLICLSACLAGQLPSLLLEGDEEGARRLALRYRELFGEDYFIELQDHGILEQKRVLPRLMRLAEELNIPTVATNDVHYLRKEDAFAQEVLMCIQTGKTVADEKRMRFETNEFYLKSAREMEELFGQSCPEALENTAKIAQRCSFEFETDRLFLPEFIPENGNDCARELRRISREGLDKKLAQIPQKEHGEYRRRLEYELDVIEKTGFPDYILIVRDFIAHAKSNGIAVGPGRGSGAGSLVLYCIGITDIDPIRYGLLFERFLNPQRVTMPDIDVDFCVERRGEVLEYLAKRYGASHVVQITTFGTMSARQVVRDVARALDIPLSVADALAKKIPRALDITLEKALEQVPELEARCQEDPQIARLFSLSKKLEGMPRHASTHAAGVVITREEAWKYLPLAVNGGVPVTQFDMNEISELGLLKIDLLGLRNLTVMQHAARAIARTHPDFSLSQIDEHDEKTFRMIAQGQTDGVFQLESGGMRATLMAMKPSRVEDIIAAVALYRPGPMDSIPLYIANKHDPDRVTYATDELREILHITYGCIVYQEQVMQIFRRLAGYSLGMADIVRRAISKKKDDVMKSERHSFLYGKTDETGNVLCEGALKHGIALQTAEKIFDNMASFAAYAFNKAHAACYGIIAYRTAWLKANYPAEYMTALLSSVVGDDAKTAAYIAEAKRLGLQVLPPDVNESGAYFTFHKKTVRFPLSGIRNVGMAFAQEVEAEREQGPFLSLTDFCQRMAERKLNKRLLECLIFAGAADSLGGNRAQLLAVYENVFDSVADAQRRSVEGQMDLFSGFMGEAEEVRAPAPVPLPVIEEMPKARLLELEREYTGLYWSGNPFAPYEQSALNRQCMGIATALEAEDESRVKTAGLLSSVRVRKSKKGNRVGSAVLTDANGQVELLAFAGVLEQYEAFWQDGLAVAVTGRLQSNDEGPARILVNALEMLREEEKDNRAPAREAQENSTASARKLSHPPGIYVRLESAEDPRLAKVKALCRIFEGNDPLYVFFAKSKTTVLVNHVRTSVCPELLAELREAVGEENVRVFGK